MLPLIYTQGVYALLFGGVVAIWIISELLGPVRWRGSHDTKREDRGSLAIAISFSLGGLLLCFLFPVLVPRAIIAGKQPLVFFLGLGCMLLGVCWRRYAIHTLGRHFKGIVAIDPDQHLVQHGPYTLIRHPSYTGALLTMGGIGVMVGNWLSLLLITAGLFLGLLHRMAVEEHVLSQAFGDSYVIYMQRTKRLIPFIY